MIRRKTILLAGAAGLVFAPAALAQTAPVAGAAPAAQTTPASRPAAQTAPPATPMPTPPTAAQDDPVATPTEAEPATVGDVVVTGSADTTRTSIDSTSYSLANDVQAATGTLADALRNVPSVEVDSDGNVSLRGDANVTILVDGRPSSQFNGASRGQLVLQLPADRYARVEVMTNPSAAYTPEGSGGVINLITKPTTVRPNATTTGSVRANVGDGERYNIGGNIAYVNGNTTVSGDAGFRHETYVTEVDRLRERLDTPSGRFLPSRQRQDIEGIYDSLYARLSIEHNLDARTQLVGELRHTDVSADGDAIELFEAENAAGGIASAYRRSSSSGFAGQFSGATARLVRRFDDQGHEWSNEVRFDRNSFSFGGETFADQQFPAATPFFELIDNRNRQDQVGITSAYVRPYANGGRLRLGYELQASTLKLDNAFARGPSLSALTPDPLVSNRFEVDQTIHAVYATYERPFGEKLSAQFGLRLEQADLDLNQITTSIRTSQDYFRAYPTGHIQYQLTDTQTLRASYSRRIQRPQPGDLNPFLAYGDAQNLRSGNPNLLPQETDAFELSWQRRVQQTSYSATLYYRDTTDAFTQTTVDLGTGVFLTRPENLGSSTSSGLEVVASGALFSTLRYNASINAYRQEIDSVGIVGGADRSGESVSGRLALNWQATPADFVQVSSVWTGDQLLAQGRREQATVVNVGYRRKLNDTWSLQATVRDVFDEAGSTTVIDTPTFRDRSFQSQYGRGAYIGLTWSFGGGQRRPEQFDFSAPAGG